MPSIIAPNQSALIEGGQILDLLLIAKEAVEDYYSKKKKSWILKLDLEKAFDRVDWAFLEKVLIGKNFEPRWISWIMGCVTHPKFSIFIKGRPRGRVLATRGIRQGDPLSTFFFLLVSEVLNVLTGRLHKKGLYEGFLVGKEKIHVSILQFADGTLIFCKFEDDIIKLQQHDSTFHLMPTVLYSQNI